jgi:hypothetical protein
LLIERNKAAQKEMLELQEKQRLSSDNPDKRVKSDHGSQSKKSQDAKLSQEERLGPGDYFEDEEKVRIMETVQKLKEN